MNLARKLTIITSTIFLTGAIVLVTLVYLIIFKDVAKNEEKQISETTAIVKASVEYFSSALYPKTSDWAFWDDTWQFLRGENPEYIESNLSVDSMVTLDVNAMLFVKPNGELHFIQYQDGSANESRKQHIAAKIFDTLRTTRLVGLKTEKQLESGLFLIDKKPMFFAARTILKSNKQGDSAGTLIMGKTLDAKAFEEIAKIAHSRLQVYVYGDPAMPDAITSAAQSLVSGKKEVVNFQTNEINHSFLLLRQYDATPALIIQFDQERIFNKSGRQLFFTLIGVILLFMFVTALMNIVLLRQSILKPLIITADTISRLQENKDLSQRIQNRNTDDEIGRLNSASNTFLEKLDHTFIIVKESTGELMLQANQINSGNTSLAALTVVLKDSMDSATELFKQATNATGETKTAADRAQHDLQNASAYMEKIRDMIATMDDAMAQLRDSGKRVAEIVEFVNEISFQTGLLSLNAAIEAARAGEAGKGFAVVASEVRSLAGRTASAAAEIKNLVKTNDRSINNANVISREMLLVITEMLSGMQDITKSIIAMGSLNQNQIEHLQELNTALNNIHSMLDRNLKFIDELAHVSNNISTISGALSGHISAFKLSSYKSGQHT